ncbi:MAG: threonylcarbamoyl-AMP synthase [Acidobacteria bacterium]|nr:threonylcarbamoyl-AMP synthase [Acidobacteriota bacterium]
MRRVFVNPEAPHRDAVQEAAARILRGRIVALPTDTLYALAVDPFLPAAVHDLYEAKGRPAQRALPLIAADAGQIRASIAPLSAAAERLGATFWPGPLTLLLRAPRALAPEVHAGTGRVGVRVPASAVARAVCLEAGRPITATSANPSGVPATADPDVVERTLGARIDFLLDAGMAPGGPPSTIVDVDGPAPRLVRAGAVPWDLVQACLARG